MAIYTITLNFSDAETPTLLGATLPDGQRQLVLQHAPSPAESLQFFRNGMLQKLGTDYILSGFFILPTPPIADEDVFVAYYRF